MSAEQRVERRIVCAWLPHWPMEVWRRAQAREKVGPSSPFGPDGRREERTAEDMGDGPFVLLARTARGDVIHGVDAYAHALGLAPGQRATDAMAVHRDLRADYADPDAETVSLGRLAAWSRRWSPLVRADGADGIALDATGCSHLWGGEAAMLADMRDRLAPLGVTARLAVAPTHGAAHALARFGAEDEPVVVDGGGLAEALAPLTVAALRLDPASVTLLRRLGLKTVGHLASLPRAALKKRFGGHTRRRDPRDETWEDYLGRLSDRSSDVLARLDEALGRVAVPLDPALPEPCPRVARGLSEPVLDIPTALCCAEPLVAALMGDLERREEGARALMLEAFRVDGGRAAAVLRLARPTRDVAHVMRLFGERTAEWRAEFGVDALAVEALAVERLAPSQDDSERRADAPDPHALIDRLRARLGAGAVRRAVPLASHWPERAEAWVPADEAPRMGRIKELAPGGAASPVAWTVADSCVPPRPDRLFDPPQEIGVIHALPEGPPARFTWRRSSHRVERVAGPERIAPEWWRERSTARARDYYRVETAGGQRLWLFREGFEGDEREGRPRWFVHGLFA